MSCSQLTITLKMPFFISPAGKKSHVSTRTAKKAQDNLAIAHRLTILSPQDDHLHPLEINLHRRLARHALGEPICWELARIVNDEIRLSKIREFLS